MTKTQRKAARVAARECVVIYVRVSTEEQHDSGAGLDAQVAECQAYAARNSWAVVEVIVEDAISGKVHPAKRPGFQRALARLDRCEAGTLLVRRQDRVSRRLRHTLDVIDAAKESGWSLATTDGRLDTASAAGEFQVNVMASVAEYERALISERTREALAARKAAGMVLGAAPSIPDDVAQRILTEHAAALSMRAIAAGLTADGVRTARGGSVWSHATVQAVVNAKRFTQADRQSPPV
jgi:DNA invertase Pin-like site-specific DNA recombinase